MVPTLSTFKLLSQVLNYNRMWFTVAHHNCFVVVDRNGSRFWLLNLHPVSELFDWRWNCLKRRLTETSWQSGNSEFPILQKLVSRITMVTVAWLLYWRGRELICFVLHTTARHVIWSAPMDDELFKTEFHAPIGNGSNYILLLSFRKWLVQVRCTTACLPFSFERKGNRGVFRNA